MKKRARECLTERLTARFSLTERTQIERLVEVMPSGDDKISTVLRNAYRFWRTNSKEAQKYLAQAK